MANNTFLPTGFTVTSTFATLASYLDAAGIDTDQAPVTSQDGYIKNNDTAIDLYIGQGTSAPSSWATIGPESAILFEAGLNTALVWIKAASSTITVDFVEGANSYNPPLVNGVIGTLTATENTVPKADSSGNLVASTISDDGAGTVTIASDTTVTGTIISDDATTPGLTIESGNTNTGFIDMKGKTSGKLRITAADATAQTVTLTTAAQTSGAGTITIPDLAGASTGLVTTTVAQTLTNKTLTAPVIGVATGTSLAVTGLLTSSGTAGIGYATGAGGAQTQATDKSTTVVSNTITTAITMNNAALNAGVTVSFTFTNSTIAATDTVICTHQSAGTSGAYTVNAFPGAGSAVISVRNNTAGNLSEAIVLRVTVIKSVSA